MSEIDELLSDVRQHEPARVRRGGRIALIIAGIGLLSAVAAGAILATSATMSIASVGLGEATADDAVGAPVTGDEHSSDITALSEPTQPAAPPVESGPPRYDASTDIATIPPPPADWPADEVANAKISLTQKEIIADCMLEKGYDFYFTPHWLYAPGQTPTSYTQNWDGDRESAKAAALWGPTDQGLGADYDWRNAGCRGYAVHVTGMDDAN
jgi:hypothetical protein